MDMTGGKSRMLLANAQELGILEYISWLNKV